MKDLYESVARPHAPRKTTIMSYAIWPVSERIRAELVMKVPAVFWSVFLPVQNTIWWGPR